MYKACRPPSGRDWEIHSTRETEHSTIRVVCRLGYSKLSGGRPEICPKLLFTVVSAPEQHGRTAIWRPRNLEYDSLPPILELIHYAASSSVDNRCNPISSEFLEYASTAPSSLFHQDLLESWGSFHSESWCGSPRNSARNWYPRPRRQWSRMASTCNSSIIAKGTSSGLAGPTLAVSSGWLQWEMVFTICKTACSFISAGIFNRSAFFPMSSIIENGP